MNVVTYTELRKNLKEVMDQSSDRHEAVIIRRAHDRHMVLIPLEAYESLKETAYLLSTQANIEHLRASIKSLEDGKLIKKDLLD